VELFVYIPKSFAESDAAVLYEFMQANNFAMLITQQAGRMTASHIPFMVDSERGVLKAHLARANDQWKGFDGSEALIIFQGPHAYISPTWYETHPSVPTWNYAAVHVYGVPQIISDDAAVRSILGELVKNHEQGRQPEWELALPEDYFQKMMQSIVVFEIPIARIEGKYKLNQNRSDVDQDSVITHLSASPYPLDNETAHLMASRRTKTP
jgi:transcriptional regulator